MSAIAKEANFPSLRTQTVVLRQTSHIFGIKIAIAMLLVIAGTVLGGKVVAFASIPFFVLAVLIYSVSSPVKALSVYVAYASMEGMFKYLSGYSQIIYLIKPILGFAILIGMLLSFRYSAKRFAAPPLTTLVILMVAWCLVIVFQPLGSGVAGGLASACLWYIAPMMALFTGYNALKSYKDIEVLLYSIVGISVVVSLFTVVQYAMGQSWTEAHLPGYASMNEGIWWIKNSKGAITSYSFRPASTTAMGGEGGLWSAWGIVISLVLLLSPKTSNLRKICLIICLLALSTGLICSAARLYLIAIIICITFLFIITANSMRDLSRNLGVLIIVGGLAWLGVLLAQSASGGLVANRYAGTLDNPLAKYNHDRGGVGGRTDIMLKHLIPYPLGVGFQHQASGYSGHGVAPSANNPLASPGSTENRDDEFNAISYDLGVPGLIFLIIVFSTSLSQGSRILKYLRHSHYRLVASVMFVLLCFTIILCFAGPNMESNEEYWLFLSCLLALPRIQYAEHFAENTRRNS